MQKVLQRAAAASKQAARKTAKKEQREWLKERKHTHMQIHAQKKAMAKFAKDARKARREDWELGPLAPNRASGTAAEQYGALDQNANARPPLPERMQMKRFNIAPGDRVVLLSGRFKGKIDRVKSIEKERGTVSLASVATSYVTVHDWQNAADGDPRPYRATAMNFEYDQVRLVYAMKDPRTNEVRDVIVDEVEVRNFQKDHTGKESWDRYIPGTNIRIEWPEEREPEYIDHPDDTLRITVEERTYIPTLLIPPFPETVIDELRGKYSKFRTRHDEDYVEKKMKEDEEVEKKKKMGVNMRTPLQELFAQKKVEKASRPPPELTEDMLARIGEVMAANKAAQKAATA
ncbi:hypothetical protein K432DRAFT_350465 [Lepidopterella palustris CBS 459.81]|uniref:KOW domain-containing protein n=1 Tax=Lepidopterella palustris CBS 459.81 TaxID=1314670 RepID=A0A8E2JGI0_9PEZI|nr:hypothetical protein K432DRAFT_350465 [Lepidopterella palustris CBS 459.81]